MKPRSFNILILSAILAIPDLIQAQYFYPEYACPVSYSPVKSNKVSLCTDDFNKDGKKDLVVTTAGKSSILLGTALGVYTSESAYISGGGKSVTGDFDGDGNSDIAILSIDNVTNNKTTISISLGKGDGKFKAVINKILTSTVGTDIVAKDFNKDGRTDAALASGTQVLVLLADLNGNLSAPVIYNTPSGTDNILAEDFNADSKWDIAISTSSGLSILFGKGTGDFLAATAFAGTGDAEDLVSGDFNKDGKTDLVLFDNNISTFLNDGTGHFTKIVSSINLTDINAPAEANDFTGDGIPDLAYSGAYSGISTIKSHGDGSFENAISSNAPIFSFATSILSTDLNNDGKPDLVVAASGTGAPFGDAGDHIGVLLNKSGGTTHRIADMTLVDADTKASIDSLTTMYYSYPNSVYDLDLPFSRAAHFTITAQSSSGTVGSVVWYLDGKIFRTNNGIPPYSLTGSSSQGTTNYNSWWVPTIGRHTILALPYSLANGNGVSGIPRSVTLIVHDEHKPDINGFTLVNADTKANIRPLVDGDVLVLSELNAQHLSIVSNVSYPIWSLKWEYDNELFRINKETVAPYCFTGVSTAGTTNYNSWWIPSSGIHTVKATPYFTKNASGYPGQSLSVTFQVVSGQDGRNGTKDELTRLQGIKAYPNPFEDLLTIDLNGAGDGKCSLYLIDPLGKVVYSENQQGNTLKSINLSSLNLNAGIYVLRIDSENINEKKMVVLNKL